LFVHISRTVAKLQQSVQKQTVYPNEILIIDGSKDDATQTVLQLNFFDNLKYFKVLEKRD
jgi:glycosyltransferase involved in cell wall biosynthesis